MIRGNDRGGIPIGRPAKFDPQNEMALVAILGPEMFQGSPVPGTYQASLMTGNDVGLARYNAGTLNPPQFAYGSAFPVSLEGLNFQAQPGTQTPTNAGTPVNNCLAINLPEQLANVGNVLWSPQALNGTNINYVLGVGWKTGNKTKEASPRTIAYLNQWNVMPVTVQITGQSSGSGASPYLGKVVQGQFAQWNSPTLPLNTLVANNVPAGNNALIINDWELTNLGTMGQLTANSATPGATGIMCGIVAYNAGGPGGSKYYYLVRINVVPKQQNPAGAGNTPTLVQLYTMIRNAGIST